MQNPERKNGVFCCSKKKCYNRQQLQQPPRTVMASNIDVSGIDTNTPVVGTKTSASNERDSRIAIKSGLQTAADEITALQNAGGGNGSALAASFSWGDATPAIITTVTGGKTVFKVELILKTAFDVSSNLTVGDSADNARLFNVSNLDLSQPGTYQSNPDYVYPVNTPVNIYLTLGTGNSTGNGIILIYIEA
jgi:hypothetical protein